MVSEQRFVFCEKWSVCVSICFACVHRLGAA
jgi:hypothetical protein